MLSKKEIKDIQSLGHKKYRDELGLFIAEGPKMVREFIHLIPGNIVKIYALEEWTRSNSKDLKIPIETVSTSELNRISQLQTPNQVIAVVKKLKTENVPVKGFIVYLDTIQDPGNMGTIIRIADWFGIDGIVCSSSCADRYNSKVIQSSMGSIARVAVYDDNNDDWLQQQKLPIMAASLKGTSIYDCKPVKEAILLIGNESQGIRPQFLQLAASHITIPGKGYAESLNAAVATGILLSHLFPQ
ncbi:MAG: TrmH family RNA methyltransferase [Flavisolibacter sp.]